MENVYYELVESEEVYVRELEVVVEVRRVGRRDRGERWRVEKEGCGRRECEGGRSRERMKLIGI